MKTSVIIPVFNQWKFTQKALVSLAETTRGTNLEVILVDNASTDDTRDACPTLGTELFGQSFHYHRCPTNLNFGPASNLGARLAQGDYLIFLNNDIELLPNWYAPLLEDFATIPSLAATGPLLLFPAREPFGNTVQHLGIFVAPTLTVRHLYEGIPAASPLAKKRRFFQAITAACMVLPRALFLDIGLFDEHYINGYEDVDLCARLTTRGHRITVNPTARAIHHTSQTAGRYAHEETNSAYFFQHTQKLLTPDWHLLCQNDGMVLRISPWQTMYASLPQKEQARLDPLADKATFAMLRDLLLAYPLWETGWRAILAKADSCDLRQSILLSARKICNAPAIAFSLYDTSRQCNAPQYATQALTDLLEHCTPWETYVACAQSMLSWSRDIGMEAFAEQYGEWLRNAEVLRNKLYEPFLAKLWTMVQSFPLPPQAQWAYTLWRRFVEQPKRSKLRASQASLTFSLLLPLQAPEKTQLLATITSLCAQDYPRWELCIVVDELSDQDIWDELSAYERIRITKQASGISDAAAANTALGMAQNQWVALIAQGCLLTQDALSRVADILSSTKEAIFAYADEDCVNKDVAFFAPRFASNTWDWEALGTNAFLNQFCLYRRDRLLELGGFRADFGSAYAYDMLLRYTEGQATHALVHVPHIVYHERKKNKECATEDALKALKSAFARTTTEATISIIPGTPYIRRQFSLPTMPPSVRILLNMCEEKTLSLLEACVNALTAKTTYPSYTIEILYDPSTCTRAERARAKRVAATTKCVHLSPLPQDTSPQEFLNQLAFDAQEDILGFLEPDLVPITQCWLEDLVAALCRKGVGVISGKRITKNNTLVHGGYFTDAEGMLRPFLAGQANATSDSFISRTVDAVDIHCFFTRHSTWQQFKGFDLTLGTACAQDFCLRLGEQGLRTVWWPYAEFIALSPKLSDLPSAFIERWQGRRTPFNSHICLLEGSWSLMTEEDRPTDR